MQQHLPTYRMFFCDPPGNTDPDALFNHGRDDVVETGYVFFHDQEPVHLDIFSNLFNRVQIRNIDISIKVFVANPDINWPSDIEKNSFAEMRHNNIICPSEYFCSRPDFFNKFRQLNRSLFVKGHVIVSERGEFVEQLAQEYGWQPHYYFYHGWACLDWFRGYDKTFLIPRARDRAPTQTFMSPNRIVGGKRDHRVLFLYNIFKAGLEHNHISAPRICPVEDVDINSIAQKYTNVYQDITNVFSNAELPKVFAGEATQEMSSCWLTNFGEAADSLVYVPTETVYFGRRTHLTEKTFKAIALEMPFVLVAPAGSLEYLREYGFKTFANIFDESYDTETDDICRIEKVTKLLKQLNDLSVAERQEIHRACLPVVEHNFEHFYGQGFSNILWTELTNMLQGLRV